MASFNCRFKTIDDSEDSAGNQAVSDLQNLPPKYCIFLLKNKIIFSFNLLEKYIFEDFNNL